MAKHATTAETLRLAPLAALLLCAPALAQTDAQSRLVCKQFIERQLHDPRDSSLEWTSGYVGRNKAGQLVVQIRGRAKNAYGALRLATFECVMTYRAPDSFNLVNLRVF